MKVPLQVYQKKVDGKERLVIWYNGKEEIVEPPIYPYFYSYEKLDLPKAVNVEKVKGIALSSNQEKTFYKYSFNNTEDLATSRIKGVTFEDNIPFIIRCRIDCPDFFTKFANTNRLKFLFLDIEQECGEGKLFPTADDNIVSISYATNNKKIECLYMEKEEKDDERILREFIKQFNKINPDVIVYYNKKYDFPRILQRCEKYGIDTSIFSRSVEKPFIGGRYYLTIDGRTIYDVFESVAGDQALIGKVKSRGLKDVAKYFGFKVIEVDRTKISELKGTKKLIEYNMNDVYLLIKLFEIYFPMVYEMANDLKIPLNESAILNITDLSSILIGENFVKRNIIADGVNEDRFPEIYSGKGYQGALVGIKKTGLFKPVYKADYSSMYPNIMANFNLSPDTTIFTGFEPLGEFRIEEEKEWYTYSIPDKSLEQNVVIKVFKKEGFITKLVKQLLKERMVYKKKYKETGDKKYYTLSWIAKVKANGGLYGTQGARHHPFGYAPIAVATTGIGRECVRVLMEVLEELYPDSVIEYDTDGVYFTTKKLDESSVLSVFQAKLKEKFKKDVKFDIDFDKYDAGYFYKAKNYILRKGDDIILHGAALNARNKDAISAKFIEEISRAKIEGKPIDKIVKKFYNFKGFNLEDFAMSFTLSKPLNSYKSKTCVNYKLAKRAKDKLGVEPEVGNIYHYVKTTYGYELLQLAKLKDIDFSYYQEKLNKILDIFKVELPEASTSLFIDEETTYDLPEFEFKEVKRNVKGLKEFF